MASSNQTSSDCRKLALIIGNDNYARPQNRLNHSISNARELNGLLRTINFDVTMHTDVATDIMVTIKDFATKIKDGDLILVYFSGHSCQVNGKNYLIPVPGDQIEADIDIEVTANDVERILDRLLEKKPYVTILILDCCRPYLLKGESTTNCNGLVAMTAPDGTFIQFACAANQTDSNNLFAKHLLKNIAGKNEDIIDVFEVIVDDVYEESKKRQRPLSMNGLSDYRPVYLNQVKSSLPDIPLDAKWKLNGRNVTGRPGSGATLDRLHYPKDLFVDKNQKIVIAVSGDHRIMRYKQSARFGRRIVGKNTSGYRSHLLCEPSDVIFDKKSKSLIICDYHHRRVVRWSPGNEAFAERLIENAECFGVAIDDTGSLYVSDTEQHEVRRYRRGDRYGTVVAGGNGQGRRLKQLNHPTYICIGKDQAVYVADSWNDRVVKWSQGAETGVVVAGGNGKGSNRNQLDYPTGILVDQLDTVYVADHWNNRVMRWYKDAVQGNVIAGGLIPGDYTNQLNTPEGLAFDGDGNLYVSDSGNRRVQRFNIRKK